MAESAVVGSNSLHHQWNETDVQPYRRSGKRVVEYGLHVQAHFICYHLHLRQLGWANVHRFVTR